MGILNTWKAKCEKCGSDVEMQAVPDGWNDAPTNFTITRTCSGGCLKTYLQMTAQQMHEHTGLPLTGWST